MTVEFICPTCNAQPGVPCRNSAGIALGDAVTDMAYGAWIEVEHIARAVIWKHATGALDAELTKIGTRFDELRRLCDAAYTLAIESEQRPASVTVAALRRILDGMPTRRG